MDAPSRVSNAGDGMMCFDQPGWFGFPTFLIDGLSIVLIDLLLAGDNALVIAMAVRALPQHKRKIAIACGSRRRCGASGSR